ncbi:MAG: tRNA-uridine aminocarboxypropyltransferase [Bacteriovoracia bacterium]
MSQRRAGHVNRCENCRVNNHFCVCEFIKPFKIETNVSLIVHVRELKLTSNTAQFAQKMLPENAEVVIRGRVHDTFNADPILKKTGRPLFLYPHEDALELNEDFKEKFPGPYHLIVPDGNWQQARKVRQREEGFAKLPAVKLPPGITCEYGLRKALHAEWVSTYEAMAHSLGILEGEEVREKLMEFFRIWVKRTQQARNGEFNLM